MCKVGLNTPLEGRSDLPCPPQVNAPFAANLGRTGQSPLALLAGPGCFNFNAVTPETEETPVTDVTTSQGQEPAKQPAADQQLLRELTERARAGGLRLTGEGGLLGELTKMVVEGALEGEMDDHLGYAR